MSGSKSSARGGTQAPELVAQPLGLTVHSMPTPGSEDADPRRTATGRLKMLLVLAVCAAPVIASYLTYFVIRPQTRSNYADLIQPTRTVPADLGLRTLDGTPVSASSLKGQWLLVVVAGGGCDALCEQQLYFQRQLVEMMGREKGRIDKLWLVNDDVPLRPEIARAVAVGQAAQVLRAQPQALARWLEPAAGSALVNHAYLVDPMGEWMMRVPANPEPGKFKRDLERLLRASASWDVEGR
jgi:hypothetical protein